MTYKLFKDNFTGYEAITIVGKSVFIPLDENNTDYQEYLKWVAAGNTPLPADE